MKDFKKLVEATDDFEELKVIYAEYEKHIGKKLERIDSIYEEIEQLEVERKKLMVETNFVCRDISHIIRDKISAIVLGIKDGE